MHTVYMGSRRTMKFLVKSMFALTSIGAIIYEFFNEFPYTRIIIAGIHNKSTRQVIHQNLSWPSPPQEIPSTCPSFSIRNETRNKSNVKCRPRRLTSHDCDDATRKYGRLPKDRECPKKMVALTNYELCAFAEGSIRTTSLSRLKLKCDLTVCENGTIRIGVVQQNFGLLLDQGLWYRAQDENVINAIITKIIEKNNPNENDFCIIACKSGDKTVKQAIIYPPFVKMKKEMENRRKINVNIVVLDSVSRQHFYRQLPGSVNVLRDIVTSPVQVLDFELFQSLAPRTFPNMRAMFSGMVDVDSNDELHTYGIDSLFGKYRNMGYQTVVQEDSCWYDSWGSLITDNRHDIHYSTTAKEFADRWQKIVTKTRHLPIDSYGLTHLSCEVFLQYGRTNQFNYPPKVCYNGHFLPAYFLNYTLDFLHMVEKHEHSYPLLTYTHLNTGHEMTGKRIAYSDAILAHYLKHVAQLDHTLTIMLSDHGPKTTKFSREFLSGRYEIAHSLLFMVVPPKIQNLLGKERVEALQSNQNRLINQVDLFHMLMSLNSEKSEGLLTPLSRMRYCEDMPIYSFTTCLCDGYDQHLPDSDDDIRWLSEFAVGYLNNEITASIPLDKISNVGYGNCERLIGKRYDKIRMHGDPRGNTVYVFDIVVEKYRDEEIFEVAVRRRKRSSMSDPTPTNKSMTLYQDAELVRWRRVSIFQHFSKCLDKFMEIELCICRKESYNRTNPGRDYARLLSINTFHEETQPKFIDSKCLVLLTRSRSDVFASYELANLCVDRLYNVTFDVRTVVGGGGNNTRDLVLSYSLPRTLKLYPWLVYFVTSVQLSGSELTKSNLFEVVTFDMVYVEQSKSTSKT